MISSWVKDVNVTWAYTGRESFKKVEMVWMKDLVIEIS